MYHWYDEIGSDLEVEGVDPGRIFEFHEPLSPELRSGGVVVTQDSLTPGQCPKTPFDIKEVIVKHRRDGRIQRQGRGWPLFVVQFNKLRFI